MSRPPEWPFRCPHEGWYLKEVKAEFDPDVRIPVAVVGVCKQHGEVVVSDPYCYSPHLWRNE